MKLFCAALSLVFVFAFTASSAQTRVFKNYGVKDGLAGSTVYCSYQDKQGFIWFGTDLGLSRFDGTNFKNYTTRDGLPDNDVFKIKEDSAGRLWMLCYNSIPGFIYQGKIHNSENDTMLRQIVDRNQLFRDINIDKQGRVWITGYYIYLIDKDKVKKLTSPGNTVSVTIGYLGQRLALVTAGAVYEIISDADSVGFHQLGTFKPTSDNSAFFFANACFVVSQHAGSKNNELVKVTMDTVIKKEIPRSELPELITASVACNPRDSVLLVSAGAKGIQAFDSYLNLLPVPYPFLPTGNSYSSIMYDHDNNTWINSLGKGVFFIPVNKTIQYKFESTLHNSNVASVYNAGNGRLILGFDYSNYGLLDKNGFTPYTVDKNNTTHNQIQRQRKLNDREVMLGCDLGGYVIDINQPDHCRRADIPCVKNMAADGRDSVLVGGIDHAYEFIKTGKGFRADTLWNMRTTAICRDKKGCIWLGSLSGLRVRKPNGSVVSFSKNALINKARITDLVCDKYNAIWVATHQFGLFVITPDTVIAISGNNGLPGDVVVRLFQEADGIMWVCGNRSVSKINYSNKGGFNFEVETQSRFSDPVEMQVNDITVDSANIWIATNEGLFQMEGRNRYLPFAPPVYVTSFKTTDSVYTPTGPLSLAYTNNNIQIDYIGVSFNQVARVLYKYVLNTSADTVFTTNTSLNLSSLSPASYRLSVWARGATGSWSNTPAVVSFEIRPPFWRTIWFILTVLAILVTVISSAIRWRIRRIKMREEEKTGVNKKIAEIELQAVRAQMNEHFIFNALSSIQNFINENDNEAANFYLGNFGKLIRRTMDMSSQASVSLATEMDYLDTYLSLEKMRFTDVLDYRFNNQIEKLSPAQVFIPSLVLQPYIENAVRHGLRYKKNGKGLLTISFAETGGVVICSVDDNGIGREEARRIKSANHVEYQSKGMKLSEDKIYLYNRIHDLKIRVEVIDKKDEQGMATGTLVKVFIPLNIET